VVASVNVGATGQNAAEFREIVVVQVRDDCCASTGLVPLENTVR
jgi:hypothetical protein